MKKKKIGALAMPMRNDNALVHLSEGLFLVSTTHNLEFKLMMRESPKRKNELPRKG